MKQYGVVSLPCLLVVLHQQAVSVQSFSFLPTNGILVRVQPTTTTTTTALCGSTSHDDPFAAPVSRWECPSHKDVCSETGVTLSRYMMEMVRANPELEEIESSKCVVSKLLVDPKRKNA
jgi:hypothetical protein